MKLDDSLTKAIRTKLKERGIKKGVTILFSNEVTEKTLVPLTGEQEKNPEEYRPLDNMRIRTVPVLGTMPSIFGMALAANVLCYLAGQPFKYLFVKFRPTKVDDIKLKVYQKWLSMLESMCKKQNLVVDFDIEDLYFAAREVCETRCAATGERAPGMSLAIWDKSKPVNGKNLLLFSSRFIKDSAESVQGMMSYAFAPEETKRIEELLRKAGREYDPKAVYMANPDQD